MGSISHKMLFKNKLSTIRFRHFFFLLLFLLPALSPAQTGANDLTFNPGTGTNGSILSTVVQADGKIIIGGGFTTYNSINKNSIARLNVDGNLDNTFVGNGVTGGFIVWAITIQPDGKIIIGGGFTAYNGTPVNRIARLNTDGSLDATFNPGGSGADNVVQKIVVQADGKILISGSFITYNGTAINRIARLNTDGSLDGNFNSGGTGASNVVGSIAITIGDKIIIGGSFLTYNGIAQNFLARLNSDGSLDATFNSGIWPNNPVSCIVTQPDGKIVIGGSFTAYNGTAINRIARLNTDGTLDATFNPGIGAGGSAFPLSIKSLAIQSDGKIVIGGTFTTYNSTAIIRIARLNADGTLDAGFSSGSGASGLSVTSSVNSIIIQPDAKIIIGGEFTAYNSVARSNIARIINTIIVPLHLINFTGSHGNSGNLLQWKTANEVNTKEFIIEKSIDGQNFTKIATVPAKSNGAGNYSYNENEKLLSRVYYRLKMIDNDDSFTYSHIISLSDHETNTLAIYPNPVNTSFTIVFTDKNLLQTKASLIDIQGKKIKQFVLNNFQQQIDFNNFPGGVYFLQFTDGTTLKVIKK